MHACPPPDRTALPPGRFAPARLQRKTALFCLLVVLMALASTHPCSRVWAEPLIAAQNAPREDVTAIILEGCHVYDPVTLALVRDQAIVIQGEKITHLIPAHELGQLLPTLPANATRVNAAGQFAVPGLIDAHVHLVHVLDFAFVTGDEVLPLYLAAGVTSIRSTGDELVAATLVARHAQQHPETSPRVFTCSPLLDASPPIHADVGRGITDPAQAAPLMHEMRRWGVSTIKIYAGTQPEMGRALIQAGHAQGFFVTAHLGNYSAQAAVADGIDGLEHIWSVFNYVIPPDVPRDAGHRGRVDFDHPLCQDLLAELARRRVLVDPTLVVFRNMILLPDLPEIVGHADNALAPKRLREFWPVYLARTGCPQGGPLSDRQAEFSKFLELTGRLHAAGVPLLAGTDSPEPQVTPGFSLHQELELLVAAGLSPAEALRCATLNNAQALKADDRLGSIAPGKLADLLLLEADPLADISNSRRIGHVIRGGKLLNPHTILQAAASE